MNLFVLKKKVRILPLLLFFFSYPYSLGSCLKSCYDGVREWYLDWQLKRRRIMIISFRLIVGWTWETVISTLLSWISGANSLDLGQLVAVDFSVVVVAWVAGYLVHLYAIRIKIPEQNLPIPPPVNEVDTENPLQQVCVY
jgi:hypothetical protein